jgi:hypothetical protein
MDTTAILIVVVFGLIAVAGFLAYQRRGRVSIKGPLGTGLEFDGSNEEPAPRPGVRASQVTSRKGRVVAEDQAGGDVEADHVDAQQDVILRRKAPPDPKA